MPAVAQDSDGLDTLELPGISNYAPPHDIRPLASRNASSVTLSAQLVEEGEEVARGMIWRIFKPETDSQGKLPLVASAQGGTSVFELEPGSYLVHASYGRAGATKRISVGREPQRENFVLNAGGLKLDAIAADGGRIPPDKLRFAIYEGGSEDDSDRALILPDVQPNTVVRLRSGIYHIVSTYGSVNAVIRSDIRVEAAKLTEATVEHHAAEITLKLVRESGGEAIADTSWSVINEAGEPVKESVGAFAPMVLADGQYTAIAKNRERIYQMDFTIEPGLNREIEVIASEAAALDPESID
ncbi:hypothetical protein ACFPLB_13050 [Aquamicrobium segne]|uniref:Uncharacterized protein n=1 Tax=Aquamicrobium segne TaxID=469547 RepID=A0ABW0GZ00_9HYPH